jgi:hypothetical protein
MLNKMLKQSQMYALLQVQPTPTAEMCISPVPSQYLYSVRKAKSTVSYTYAKCSAFYMLNNNFGKQHCTCRKIRYIL